MIFERVAMLAVTAVRLKKAQVLYRPWACIRSWLRLLHSKFCSEYFSPGSYPRAQSTDVSKSSYQVCIVGGGPIGLILSRMLSHYGVHHCIIERRHKPASHPQAHFINARSMEVLLSFAPEAHAEALRQMPPSEAWRDFVYCHTILDKSPFCRIDHFSPEVTPAAFWSSSPTSVVHLAQSRLETILRQETSRFAPYFHSASRVSHSSNTSECRPSSEETDHNLRGKEVFSLENVTLENAFYAGYEVAQIERQSCSQAQSGSTSLDSAPIKVVIRRVGAGMRGAVGGRGEFCSSEGIIGGIAAKTAASVHGAAESITVECDYLVGADGAHSFVRRWLGIDWQAAAGHTPNTASTISTNLKGGRTSSISREGGGGGGYSSSTTRAVIPAGAGREEPEQEPLQHLVNVHFTAPGLFRRLQPRPAMLYFVFNQAMVSVLVAHDPREDEWVCQVPFFPPYQSLKDFDGATVQRLLRSVIGSGMGKGKGGGSYEHPIIVKSINSWVMHAQVASKYCVAAPDMSISQNHAQKKSVKMRQHDYTAEQSPTGFLSDTECENEQALAQRRGRGAVLLAGDAVHRFPPAGGFGMNTGLQDAHNLAWKLFYVAYGRARPSLLLDSYQAERKAVAEANTALSLHNYSKSASAARALGVDPALARLAVRDVAGSALAQTLLPFTLRKRAVLAALNTGLSSLAWLEGWAQPGNWTGRLRVRALQMLAKEGQTLPLIFPEEDLGFVYGGGAYGVAGVSTPSSGDSAGTGAAGAGSWRSTPRQDSTVVAASSPAPRYGSASEQTPLQVNREAKTTTAGSIADREWDGTKLVVGGRVPHCWLQVSPCPTGIDYYGGSDSDSSKDGGDGCSRVPTRILLETEYDSPALAKPRQNILLLSTIELPVMIDELIKRFNSRCRSHSHRHNTMSTITTTGSDSSRGGQCDRDKFPLSPILVLVPEHLLDVTLEAAAAVNARYYRGAFLVVIIGASPANTTSGSASGSNPANSASGNTTSAAEGAQQLSHGELQLALQRPRHELHNAEENKRRYEGRGKSMSTSGLALDDSASSLAQVRGVVDADITLLREYLHVHMHNEGKLESEVPCIQEFIPRSGSNSNTAVWNNSTYIHTDGTDGADGADAAGAAGVPFVRFRDVSGLWGGIAESMFLRETRSSGMSTTVGRDESKVQAPAMVVLLRPDGHVAHIANCISHPRHLPSPLTDILPAHSSLRPDCRVDSSALGDPASAGGVDVADEGDVATVARALLDCAVALHLQPRLVR